MILEVGSLLETPLFENRIAKFVFIKGDVGNSLQDSAVTEAAVEAMTVLCEMRS